MNKIKENKPKLPKTSENRKDKRKAKYKQNQMSV